MRNKVIQQKKVKPPISGIFMRIVLHYLSLYKSNRQKMIKYFIIFTLVLIFWGCKTKNSKPQIAPIYSKLNTLTIPLDENGATHTYTTSRDAADRLKPNIKLLTKRNKKLKFRIQGNISSGGLSMNRIIKIRLEKEEQKSDSLTLRYHVEIRKISGKESATIKGYNYAKDMVYNIPKNKKVIRIQLYHDHIMGMSETNTKLMEEQILSLY